MDKPPRAISRPIEAPRLALGLGLWLDCASGVSGREFLFGGIVREGFFVIRIKRWSTEPRFFAKNWRVTSLLKVVAQSNRIRIAVESYVTTVLQVESLVAFSLPTERFIAYVVYDGEER